MSLLDVITRLLNPGKNPDLDLAFHHSQRHLPVLWLLGKTGAGKSTLVQALTGLDSIEIGKGFRPCTLTAVQYDHPAATPVVSFLDTRGLAEASYDAHDDIEACQGKSHALIVVMKADDPEQSDVLRALRQIRSSGRIRNMLLVHTGIELLEDPGERARSIAHQQERVQSVWGPVDPVAVDFIGSGGGPVGLENLLDKLGDMMPVIAQMFDQAGHGSAEEKNFRKLKAEIMWYAGAAGASDAVPALGLVTVPSFQAKMLHSLANHYGLAWNRKLLLELSGALGTSFGLQYVSRLGLQQLVKLIPGYGQTIGAASAAVASYCFTYALGRAACYYFYAKQCERPPAPDEVKKTFKDAFNHIFATAKENFDEN
ncbi:MAG: GTP-binding DUF697 domain-containing protein [Pigmentiphaga sp.]|nr:GTP-binding DUF697 domain-containing protein [Pigmentiphaga sp.]